MHLNKTEICNFKGLHNINPCQFCLGSVSKNITINETKEIALNETVYDFSIDYGEVDKKDILNIYETVQNVFRFFKQLFITLLCYGRSLAKKCIFLDNLPCMMRTTLIDLNLDGLFQGLHHYLFMVSLDRCDRNYNTINDTYDRICVSNKQKM